jgi:NAD(P)-dependent dehydrogenase (short-subunit alcohol dehydrogenase family)
VSIPQLDMNDPAAVDGFAATLDGKLLDAVLVNAGVAGPEHRSASAATAAEIGALMFTNAIAPVRLARALIPNLRPRSGVVAFTSSVMGSVAENPGGHELYRASKAALNSLTRGLWSEMRSRNLTMVSVHPGWVRTDMAGPSAPVSVEDSAAGIVTVLEQQSGAHQHRFLDYTGKELPW